MKLKASRAREAMLYTRAHEAWPAGSRNDRITIKALLILLCSSQMTMMMMMNMMRSLVVLLLSLFLFAACNQNVEAKLSISKVNLQGTGKEKNKETRALTQDTEPDYVGMEAEVRFLLSHLMLYSYVSCLCFVLLSCGSLINSPTFLLLSMYTVPRRRLLLLHQFAQTYMG